MRLINKFIILITVVISIISLAFDVYSDSNDLVFEWQPFIVNDDLELNRPAKNVLPKNLFVFEKILGQSDYIEDLLHTDLMIKNDSLKENTKKSAFSKIKVTVSSGNSFMMPGDENYSRSGDGKLSQVTKTLPSFFQNPSQEKALETLKLIEPQVNFGFEF
jgi:hypothetical protein